MTTTPEAEDRAKPRAVLDAMVWARGFVGRNAGAASAALVHSWQQGSFHVIVSGELLEEVAGTLFELGADREDIVRVLALLATESQVVTIQHQRMGCDDEEDDHLLEAAVTGKADYLVSEDRAVYELPTHVRQYLGREGIQVFRAHEFYAELERLAAK